MSREYIVMLIIFLGIVTSILIFVRKKNIKKAFLAALLTQLFTWSLGLLLVSWGKIEYPVRLFPKAVDNSLLHGYLLNPTIFAIYYIHYPKGAKLIWRWVYILTISFIPIFIEILESMYTNLIRYKNWSPFYTWMLGIAVYFNMRKYLDWFFKNVSKQGVFKNEA